MNKKGGAFVVIGAVLLVIAVIVVIIFAVKYYKNHPCLEYETYCYYNSHGFGIGIGSDSDGDPSITPMFMSHKVYVDCSEKNLAPNIQEEKRCIKR